MARCGQVRELMQRPSGDESATGLEWNTACFVERMTLKKQMKRRLGKKATRRIFAVMPWIGGALAVAAGAVLRKQGIPKTMEGVRGMPAFSKARGAPSAGVDRDNELVGSR
jgi:hypothetical protein